MDAKKIVLDIIPNPVPKSKPVAKSRLAPGPEAKSPRGADPRRPAAVPGKFTAETKQKHMDWRSCFC